MKKLYALAAAGALAIGGLAYAAVGDVVFQSSLSVSPATEQGDGSAWTSVNGGHSSTFVKFGSAGHGSDQQLRIWQNVDGIQQNDWLVSPRLALEAGKTYEVSCWFKFHAGTSTAAHVALHHTTVYPTVSGMDSNIAPESALAQYNDVNGDSKSADDSQYLTSYTLLSGKFIAAEGDNYVAFHVGGDYKGGIYVSDFSIVEAEADTRPVDPVDPTDPEEPEGPHECTGLTLPYASTIATSSSAYDPAWTVKNLNEDNREWTPATDGGFADGLSMKITYPASSGTPHNDYLISPAMHMEEGKEYVVIYSYATRGADELLSVFLCQSNDPDEIQKSAPFATHNKVDTKQKATPVSQVFTPETTGDYHLSFWANSPVDKWYIWVGDVKVMENVFAPAAVSALTATPAENPTLEVALTWALPTTDAFGNEIGEDKVLEKIEIYRDEDERPIATFTEAVTSFTDSEEYGLTSGKHTYSVVVTYNGAASPAAKVGPTSYVGPYAPLPLPADMTVTSDMLGAWTAAYGENHAATANSWEPYTSSRPDRWRYSAKSDSPDDAWLFSPMFIVPEAGYYTLDMTAKLGSTYAQVFVETYLAGSQAIDAEMTSVKLDWNKFKTSTSTQQATFYAAAPGNYCIATRVNIPSADYGAMIHELHSIKIDRGQMIPETVTGLKATAAADESLSITVSWTNPTQSSAGTELAAGSWYTEVYRQNGSDFDLIATLTEGESSYVDTALPASGAYTYGVQTLATGTNAHLENQPTVTSSWAGPRELPMPYSAFLNRTDEPTRYIWEGVDGNDDGLTWGFGYSDRMVCPQPATDLSEEEMPGYYQYNDYLLSPIFDLKPGYYELTFQMYGRTSSHGSYNYDIAMNVGLTPAGGFIPGRSEIIGKTQVVNNASSYNNRTVSLKVETAGKYQIVFAADEINYKIYSNSTELGLGKVDFAYKPVLPGTASELSVEPGADGALTAILRWKNPSVSSIEGIAPELTKAIITRDGQEVAIIEEDLVAGEMSEWEDEAVPASGIHVYTVTMFTAEGAHTAAAPEVKSPWIGKGLEAPYAVEPGQFVDHAWEQHCPNMTTTSWGNSNCFDLTTSNGARYDKGSNDVDGYLMTPKFEIVHTQGYKLTVEAWKTSMTADEKANGYPVEILAGSEGTPDTWTKIGTIAVKNSTSTVTPDVFYVIGDENFSAAPAAQAEGEDEEEVETPAAGSTPETAVAIPAGTQRLAFHINSNYDKGLFMFHAFKLDKEGEITGIAAVKAAAGIILDGSTLRFEGVATDIRIHDLSGKLVSYTEEAEGSISLEKLAKGIYIVRLTIGGSPAALKLVL